MTEKFRIGILWLRSDKRPRGRQSKIEKKPRGRKSVGIIALAFTFVFGGAVARSQQPGKIPRIGYLIAPSLDVNGQALKEMEVAAGAFGMKLQYLDVLVANDIANAFREASKAHADAVLVLASSVLLSQRTRITDLVIKNRVPAIYPNGEYVEDGGLMSYGPNIPDLFRRAATYVDKILKGAKPADLPVEQPTKFEFGVNLKAAKQIGLTIPPNVLARADKVIK
jgi:putative ABC transport system substrate-binding protein